MEYFSLIGGTVVDRACYSKSKQVEQCLCFSTEKKQMLLNMYAEFQLILKSFCKANLYKRDLYGCLIEI